MFYFDEEHNERGFDAPFDCDSVQHGSMNRCDSNSSHDSEQLARRSNYYGRDTDRFFGSFEEEDEESEGEEPAELVPLGMRGGRSPRNKRNSQSTGFFDFYKMTEEHLGSGAYAKVQTCVSIATGKEYAVKIVSKKEESHTRSRIMREVKTFNLCKNHPNIVQLVEWFEDSDNFYMIFEKMRGGPLLSHILEKGNFTEEEARKVTKDIATALKFLHDKGIAHRDVKPENVLCTEPDRVSPVKLCDLDLASRPTKCHSPPRMTQVASEPDLLSPVGSAEFMAPEVVDAFVGEALKYDKRCDMWSLGVIVYVMLCGYTPFQGECDDDDCGWMDGQPCDDCQQSLFDRIQKGEYDFPDEEWENISYGAKDLVRHLLVKNVRERYTAEEVLQHPWVKKNAPPTALQTPTNLFRKDSARDVQQMSEHFNAMQRMISTRLSQHREGGDLFDFKEPIQEVPLFMIPPAPFFDPMSNTVVYPPSSLVDSPILGSSLIRPKPSHEHLSSCQSAVAKQDSLVDLQQLVRQTKVNV